MIFPSSRVRCAQRLPAEAEVKVVLGPQVKTRTGIERSTAAAPRVQGAARIHREAHVPAREQGRRLPARHADRASISTHRCRATPPPASGSKRRTARPTSPSLDANVKTVGHVEFKGPFPEKTSFTVELPRSFKDDAGREPAEQIRLPACDRNRRVPAARQVSGALRHPRAERRSAAARHRAQRRGDAGRRQASRRASGNPAQSPDARRASTTKRRSSRRSRSFMRRRARERRARKRSSAIANEGEVRAIGENEKAAMLRGAARPQRKGHRGHRHPAEETRLLHRRAREPAARTRAARRRQTLLRLDERARHQSRGASQARPRKLARVGDLARPRQARARTRASPFATAPGKVWFEGTHRRIGHRDTPATGCRPAPAVPALRRRRGVL